MWPRGSGPLPSLAWKNPQAAARASGRWDPAVGRSCARLESVLGACRGWGGGGHFLLPPPPSPRSGLAFPLQICQEPKQDSLPAFLWGCFPPRSGQGLAGGSSRSLPARGGGGGRGCLGLGAGVTRGQALERGGNAAFSESSAFLRSNRETLAPSLRAPSLARCSRVPSQGSAGSQGTPGHGGFWGPRWPQTPQRGCPGPCGGAGWEGRGPPRLAVGGRAGGWVGRVCIGAAWFRRGGWQRRGGGCWEPRSCAPAGPAAPPGAPQGPSRLSAAAEPPAAWGWGEAVGPPRLGRKELRVFLALLGSAQQHGLGVGLGCSGFSQRWRGVRQDAGRAQAGVSQMERGGGLGCRLTSGGPGEVCGAPPGRPGYRARAAGMPALVEDGGRGWGGCSCPGRFPPAMWDGAGKAAKRPPPPHSGSQRGEEWELPCPPWARGWAPLGDRSGPVPFPKHGLCTPTGRAAC